MERPYTGLTASVKIGDPAEVIAYVSGVDLTLEKDIIEILAFGMEYKEKVPAIKDWNVSIDGTVALAAGGTQEALKDAFDSGDAIIIGVFMNEFNYFEGSGYVQSFNINAAPDDKINLTSEIAGTGAVVLTVSAFNIDNLTEPPEGDEDLAYTGYTVTADGGTAPYTFAVTSGVLPPGLSMSTAGVISGTPTVAGTYDFVVTATDADDDTAAREFTIVVVV